MERLAMEQLQREMQEQMAGEEDGNDSLIQELPDNYSNEEEEEEEAKDTVG